MAFSSNTSSEADTDLNALHEINVTPFIDVMLVLLIIFMVTAPLSTADVPIDLPSTTRIPKPTDMEPLVVSLKNSGQLYIRETEVTRSDFSSSLFKASENNKQAQIFLRADKNVNYASLMALMDLLHDTGFNKVSLVGLEATSKESKP